MQHEGYDVEKDDDGSWRVRVGEKVIGVGYPDKETGKAVVTERRRKRTQRGLDPAG